MDLFTFLSKLIWPAIFVYVLIRYEGAIREFLGSLKDWAEISGPGMGMKRKIQASTTAPPEPTGKMKPETMEDLSLEAKKVISTLWKHQKEYYPDNPRKGRWSFMVGLGSPSFADYLIGVGQNLKKGLVTINPKDGQCLLTDAGIYYCEGNEGVLLNDWDYERWKK
jgi:hypothetical protein